MHLIYEALKKTGGKTDGDALIAAAKGMKWESPRGPISIDPETRDIVQTVYIRRVEKVGGETAQRRVRQDRERQGSGERPDEDELTRNEPDFRSFPRKRESSMPRTGSPLSTGTAAASSAALHVGMLGLP